MDRSTTATPFGDAAGNQEGVEQSARQKVNDRPCEICGPFLGNMMSAIDAKAPDVIGPTLPYCNGVAVNPLKIVSDGPKT